MNILDPAMLRDAILRERSMGVVTVDYRSAEPFSAPTKKVDVDQYVVALGFSPLGNQWRYVYRKEARQILSRILERDLAYRGPIMAPARAEELADSFVRLFSRVGSQYCTNFLWAPDGTGSGCTITSATFDEGIVAYDDQHIGILWAQDED